MPYRIGVDVGGTFVDVVVSDEGGGHRLSKSMADPDDLAGSVLSALAMAASAEGVPLTTMLAGSDRLVHGSTVATNALLTHRGASVGLITTDGFRDVLNMRRGVRDRPMDSRRPPPLPLVARSKIFGVVERLDADGGEIMDLDRPSLDRAIASLSEAAVDSVAVCFMFSFLDGSHEEETRSIIEERLPHVFVSLSSEVLPQIGLYERVSTTAVNAFVSPLLGGYLDSLVERLRGEGFAGSFLVMQSNGGVSSAEAASRFGVRGVLSGPAAAPVASAGLAGLYGVQNAISVDMGGTSFDVCLIHDGKPTVTSDGELAGHRIALPMVAIHTIGAGGGSIVSVDSRGLLSVGPQSAGADPGPACYGRGGTEPTVTDANLLLGFVAPEMFWGGRLDVDVAAAERAMLERVADPLGIDVMRAAWGAYRVVNENMVDAIREVSVRRGFDPREFVLVAAGGAGPLHIGRLAEELEIPVVLIPRLASVFCAFGGLLSDLRYEGSLSMLAPLRSLDDRAANVALDAVRTRLLDTLTTDGVAASDIDLDVLVGIRYAGQFHEIEVSLRGGRFSADSRAELAAEFHRRHEVINGYQEPSHELDAINARVVATGRTARTPAPKTDGRAERHEPQPSGERRIYWDGDVVAVPLHDRMTLDPGSVVRGPAIVVEETTSIVVPPGFDLLTDAHGNGLMYQRGADLDRLLDALGSPIEQRRRDAAA